MADIMFAGIGGQGVLTAGKILIQIAAENGKNVSWTSEYSAEMRGGIALCRVVVSDEEIGSPYPDTLDVLVCMNEDAYDTYIGQVADGAKVIINQSLFSQREYPSHVEVFGVDAMGICINSSSLIRLRITLTTRAYPVRRTCSVLKQDMRKQGGSADL